MILATASAIHGYGKGKLNTKGLIMAVAAIMWGGLAVLLTLDLYLSLTVAGLSIAWWFVLRGSRQAKISLDRMDTINEPHPTERQVLKAYYWTGWLTILALRIWNYENKPHLVNNGKFWDCRRPTEMAGGLTGDLIILAVMVGAL